MTETEIRFRGVDIEDMPQIKSKCATRFLDDAKLEVAGTKFDGTCLVADSTFFQLFEYPLIYGDVKTVLKDPANIVLTSEMAGRIFGKNNPIGQEVQLYEDNLIKYRVAGVISELPGNASMQFDYIVPTHSTKEYWGRMGIDWVKLAEGADLGEVEKTIAEKFSNRNYYDFKLIPLTNAYFDFSFELMPANHGDRMHLRLLQIILVLVFGLSMFNFFAIYALVHSVRRKEYGVKKILGENISKFLIGSLYENAFLCIVAFGMAVLAFFLILPVFTNIIGKSFSFGMRDLLLLAGFFFTVLFLNTVLSVLYSRKILNLQLSGKYIQGKGFWGSFKIVTLLQYTITITLLIVTYSLFRQFKYMSSQDLNMSVENVIKLDFFNQVPMFSLSREQSLEFGIEQQSNSQFLKNELDNSPLITSYCYGYSPLEAGSTGWKKSGETDYMDVGLLQISDNYNKVFDLELAQGRFFDKEQDKSGRGKVVINEAALRYFGVDDISKEKLCHPAWGGDEEPWQIIGVVKDFHNEHLSKPVSPLVMVFFNYIEENWYLRYKGGTEQETLAYLEGLHAKVSLGEIFNYRFMKDDLEAVYKNDRIQLKLYSLLTVLALFVSLLGISALSLHQANQRAKETAIRKVNGCTAYRAIYEMMHSYVLLVVAAFGISCFAGWYFVYNYLKNFANKLPISYSGFLLSGTIVIIVSIIILYISLYRIANRNPVKFIQNEQ